MPAINRATDTGARARFKALHGLSVVITLAHIALAGYVLARMAGAHEGRALLRAGAPRPCSRRRARWAGDEMTETFEDGRSAGGSSPTG
jgi:hypothetical protein